MRNWYVTIQRKTIETATATIQARTEEEAWELADYAQGQTLEWKWDKNEGAEDDVEVMDIVDDGAVTPAQGQGA